MIEIVGIDEGRYGSPFVGRNHPPGWPVMQLAMAQACAFALIEIKNRDN
ncbi:MULTISPECIES: hypothetical protein [unclassified Dickeya]|nr:MULTISPECIES: hypothetical protein [unclassified Dickeya]